MASVPYNAQRFEIGRVFSATFATIGRNAPLYFGFAFLISGLPAILFQYFLLTGVSGGRVSPDHLANFYSHFAMVFVPYWLFAVVVGTLLQTFIARATVEDLTGNQPSIGECFSASASVLPQAIGIALLVAIASGFAMLLLIVPGVMLWLGWCVAIPVVVQEREGVFDGMSRSRFLTRGSRWALFALFLILAILVWIVQLVVGFAGGLSTFLVGPYIGGALGAGIASTVSVVIMNTAAAAAYVELRQAKEGTGIDELAQVFA